VHNKAYKPNPKHSISFKNEQNSKLRVAMSASSTVTFWLFSQTFSNEQ